MKQFMKKVLGVAVLGIVSAAANAAPLLDFTVAPSSTGTNVKPNFVADKVTGPYVELFTAIGGLTPMDPTDDNRFATVAFWQATSFSRNDGVTTLFAPVTGLGLNYNMYAVFSATGTFAGAPPAAINFLADGGSIQLYIDPSLDTTLALPATGNLPIIVTDANADDYLIASAPLSSGEGNANAGNIGTANGQFDIVFYPLTLTSPAGEAYFVAPDPFYLAIDVSGQFVSFDPNGNSIINGSADGIFLPIPEPGSLALIGAAVAGIGFTARRRKA
jgi:hypothetical protein